MKWEKLRLASGIVEVISVAGAFIAKTFLCFCFSTSAVTASLLASTCFVQFFSLVPLQRFLKLHNAISVYTGQPHRTTEPNKKKQKNFGMRIIEHVTDSRVKLFHLLCFSFFVSWSRLVSSYCVSLPPLSSSGSSSSSFSHFRLHCFHVFSEASFVYFVFIAKSASQLSGVV